MKYDKLVRDRIPEIIIENGGDPKYHICSDQEYLIRLFQKIFEELAEFIDSETAEELADVIECVYALQETGYYSSDTCPKVLNLIDYLARDTGLDMVTIEAVRLKKHKERGGFSRRIILDEV